MKFPGDVSGVSGGYMGGVWGYLSGIHGNLRCSDVFGSPSLQYGAVTLFWYSPEGHDFFHLTILRHKNIKMSIYKVDQKSLGFMIF